MEWAKKSPGLPFAASGACGLICSKLLKSDLHAAVKGDGLAGRDHARVGHEIHRVPGILGICAPVEERAIGKVVIIKEIVDEAKELHIFGELIVSVEIGHPIHR